MLTKLLIECGWKEEVNLMCRKVIHERGVDHITTDDLVREITPQARGIQFIKYFYGNKMVNFASVFAIGHFIVSLCYASS